MPHIEIVKGLLQWHYRVVASNVRILSFSQKYFSKSNASRAAHEYGRELKLKVTYA